MFARMLCNPTTKTHFVCDSQESDFWCRWPWLPGPSTTPLTAQRNHEAQSFLYVRAEPRVESVSLLSLDGGEVKKQQFTYKLIVLHNIKIDGTASVRVWLCVRFYVKFVNEATIKMTRIKTEQLNIVSINVAVQVQRRNKGTKGYCWGYSVR